MRLLIATHNRGKLIEYQEMLAGLPLELVSLDDAGIPDDVEETGATFAENARTKALAYARRSELLTLADDSGLEVDALSGEPGVRSRRYAGENKSDPERITFLLAKLRDVPREKRSARFRCAIAIATPHGGLYECDGMCEGTIEFAPRGAHGFGYDPVFLFPERGLTMAELSSAEKNKISHRAKATDGARRILERIIGNPSKKPKAKRQK
ncbi:MAG: XTP/dITP diphosphatase [Chloroflexota bacterium]|nr:XTP/dITP diphosphatase [Chloroflexota bacterium]